MTCFTGAEENFFLNCEGKKQYFIHWCCYLLYFFVHKHKNCTVLFFCSAVKMSEKLFKMLIFFFFPLCSLLIFTPAGFLVLMCEYTVHCHLCDTKPTIGFSFSKKCRKPSDKWIYQKLPLICVQKHRTHLPVITSVKLVLHLEFYLSL